MIRSNTRKLFESFQQSLNESVSYSLPSEAETFNKYEKAENYNEATNACKMNAFKANLDLGEDIYAGIVTLEDGTIEQHYFNVENGVVKDHSNIFKTGTPKEYKGINLSELLKSKGYTSNADGSASNSEGELLNVTITTGGIVFNIDGNKLSYDEFKALEENLSESIRVEDYLKKFDSEEDIKKELSGAEIFTPDKIEYIGDSKPGNCKQNTVLANMNDKNQEVYTGYIVMKDGDALFGIPHYFNVEDGIVIEHTAVKDTKTYKEENLLYYIGEREKQFSIEKKEESEKLNEAVFEIDYAEDGLDNEYAVIEAVKEWLKPMTNSIDVSLVTMNGDGGWPVVRLSGDKDKIANFLYNNEYGDSVEDVCNNFLLKESDNSNLGTALNAVAEKFKQEIISEYNSNEEHDMSDELINKIAKALADEGLQDPEDWVADVAYIALDMTPTGEALAEKQLNEAYLEDEFDFSIHSGEFDGDIKEVEDTYNLKVENTTEPNAQHNATYRLTGSREDLIRFIQDAYEDEDIEEAIASIKE